MRMRVTFLTSEEDLGSIIASTMGKVQGLEITNAVPIKVVKGNRSAAEIILPLIKEDGTSSATLVNAVAKAGASKAAGYAALKKMREERVIIRGRDDLYRPGKG